MFPVHCYKSAVVVQPTRYRHTFDYDVWSCYVHKTLYSRQCNRKCYYTQETR